MSETFVVVGGDAAGMSAASKAKRDDPDLDVIVFERGEYVSYSACGLPYYVKGDVATLDDLVEVTLEEFREERGVDLHTGHEVVAIDPEARSVTVEAGGERFERGYDHLLIATGARAVEPSIDGAELDGVFTFRSMEAGGAVRSFLDERDPGTVGLVGAGYIGLELAEAFAAHGVDVHVFEVLPHVLRPFGATVAERVEDHLHERGVALHLDTAVDGFVGAAGRVVGVAADGEVVPVDLVVVGTGVRPNVELAEAAGIELGPTGAIARDEYGRTSAERVYAAGDCAEATNLVTGEPDWVPLALTANRHGRAVGRTVAGTPTEGGGIVGTAVVKVFDREVARTGVVHEDEARGAGFDPVTATITSLSRADYYPGARPITVHLVGDRGTGRLLGGALVGAEGVARRVDVVATALHAGATVAEVERLDLAYAPPFGPVWDPVLTAAKVLNGRL